MRQLPRSRLTLLFLAGALACRSSAPGREVPPAAAAGPAVPYGANPAAGHTFVHDGVTLYYEVYGAGDPLLLIHGNGASIGSLAAQIAHFRQRYRVIAMDSREQGRSGGSDAPITYEAMADDLAALLEHLHTGPANVIGWSDGGIEALLLGLRHPTLMNKLAVMAANLEPAARTLYPEATDLVRGMLASLPDTSPGGARERKVLSLVLTEPHISTASLRRIKAPTLVLSGDHDVVRLSHTVEIYEHLPNAQLAIFPNSTHMAPYDDPGLFNTTVERFLRAPFVPKDRIADLMKSWERLEADLPR